MKLDRKVATPSDKYIAGVGAIAALLLAVILLPIEASLLFKSMLVGAGIQALIMLLLMANLSPHPEAKRYRIAYALCGGIMLAILVLTPVLHGRFHGSDTTFMGMEPATALLVFGITFWPFSFVTLWSVGFCHTVFRPETVQAVQAAAERD